MINLTIYKNGFEAKFGQDNDRTISAAEIDGKFQVQFEYKCENPEKPACLHRAIEDKRVTNIQMSSEAMEALAFGYHHFKKQNS